MSLGRLRSVFDFGNARRDPGNEVESELEFHFRETIDLLQRQGYDEAAAEREAMRRFGDYPYYRNELERLTRKRISWARMRDSLLAFFHDLRYAGRGLVRSPAFFVGAILTLALGIAATSVMVSLVNGVILRPLPFPDPDRLVRVYDTDIERGRMSSTSSPASFVDWRNQQTSFANIAAYQNARATYTDVQPPEALLGANVSAEWFDAVGVLPAMGRPFTRDEEVFGNHLVVIVSHGFWERFLNADPAVVGTTVLLEGDAHVLVGVMPEGFEFPNPEIDIWRPLAFDFDVATARGVHYLTVIARLGPDATLVSAGAEMDVIMSRLRDAYPEQLEGWGVRLTTLQESIVGNTRSRMLVFLGAVMLVLAVAWVNVAHLVMARCTARSSEFSVRSALGAGRWRLTRLLLVEGLLIAGMAGAVGLVMGFWTLEVVKGLAAGQIPRLDSAQIDGLVIAGVAGLSAILGIALGIVPTAGWSRMRSQTADWMRIGTGTRRHTRLRSGFVVAQIALAMVLAVGAGLLVRSFQALRQVDPGYDVPRALTATIAVPRSRYPDPATRSDFFVELTDRLTAVPGVSGAAATTQLPLEGYSINFSYWIGDEELPINERPNGDFRVVTPGYFETMGIPVLQGREFRRDDTRDAPQVILINETLVQSAFPNIDPIGQRITISYQGGNTPREIVGVVRDVRQRALDVPPRPGYYLPIQQVTWSTMRVVLRTDAAPATFTAPLRSIAAELDPLIAVRDVRSLSQRHAASVGSPKFNMFVLLSMAIIAVILAVCGIYSVTSYVVAQRTREIGIRMALGAKQRAVQRAVSRGAVSLAVLGVAIGIALAIATTRALSGLLFEVRPTDGWTFALSAVAFILVSWLGSYMPARRATRVDPVVALKAE